MCRRIRCIYGVNDVEIVRASLLKVIKTARMADKLAKDTQELLTVTGVETRAGEIAGLLADIVYEVLEEHLSAEEDFYQTSLTMKLLESKLTDEEITDYILHRAELPKPVIMDQDETRMMFERNGGYQYFETPEGEWH